MIEQRYPSGTVCSPSVRERAQPYLSGRTVDEVLSSTRSLESYVYAPLQECLELLDDRLRRVIANEGFNLQFLRDALHELTVDEHLCSDDDVRKYLVREPLSATEERTFQEIDCRVAAILEHGLLPAIYQEARDKGDDDFGEKILGDYTAYSGATRLALEELAIPHFARVVSLVSIVRNAMMLDPDKRTH